MTTLRPMEEERKEDARVIVPLPWVAVGIALADKAYGILSGGRGRRNGGRRPRRRAQEQAKQDALERGLAVDAVVVGAAEDRVRHLRQAAAEVAPLGVGEVRGEDAGPCHPAVARFEHRVVLLAVPRPEARRAPALLGHEA